MWGGPRVFVPWISMVILPQILLRLSSTCEWPWPASANFSTDTLEVTLSMRTGRTMMDTDYGHSGFILGIHDVDIHTTCIHIYINMYIYILIYIDIFHNIYIICIYVCHVWYIPPLGVTGALKLQRFCRPWCLLCNGCLVSARPSQWATLEIHVTIVSIDIPLISIDIKMCCA